MDGLVLLVNIVMNWGNMVEIIINFEVLEMENLKEYGYNDEYKLMERFNFLFCMGIDDFGELRFRCGDENVEMDLGDDIFSMYEDFVCDECDNRIWGEWYYCKICLDFDFCKYCYLILIYLYEFEFIEEENDCDDDGEMGCK